MVKQIEDWMTPEIGSKYIFAEDDICAVWYVGLFAYSEGNGIVLKSSLDIAHLTISGKLNHNKLFGFFKIVVLDKHADITYFWGDNSGSKRFYYCMKHGVIADTLPTCIKRIKTNLYPCFEAIYQYFAIERTIDEKTIVDGVLMTARESVFILKNGEISKRSKELLPFSALDQKFCLIKLMKILTYQIKKEHVSAIVTGGTDSRCILAHLVYQKIFPKLYITGREESKDVKVAKKIADTLRLPLDVYNPNDKEPNWLQLAFEFSNGIYDVVLSYRHLRKAKSSSKQSIAYEFGGVGGEFYKNSYCRPFRYAQPFKPLTAKSIIDHAIGKQLPNKMWYGEEVTKAQKHVYHDLCMRISEKMEKGFLRNYNILAEEMLAGGFCAITDNMTPFCTKIDPLMDRNLIASVCYKKPIVLSMARWQRREIFLHCPSLSEIETDQDLSCSLRLNKMIGESFMVLKNYSKLALNRIQRIILKEEKNMLSQWNKDYEEARTMSEYIDSVVLCQRLGIISEKVSPEDIPISKTGFILMIGMFFKHYK